MATIIRVDGTREALEPEGEDGELTFEQLSEAVGGDIALADQVNDEGYYVPHAPWTFYVHEEGEGRFPKNPAASRLAGKPLYGTVVHCTRREAGLDSASS
jgi:hypothetical protein